MQQKEVNKVFLYPVTMDSWGSDRGSEFPCSRLSVAMIHFLYCLLFWPDYINRSNTSPNSTPVPLMTVSNCTEYKNEKSELFKNMVLFKTDLITPAPLASALTKRYLLVKGPIILLAEMHRNASWVGCPRTKSIFICELLTRGQRGVWKPLYTRMNALSWFELWCATQCVWVPMVAIESLCCTNFASKVEWTIQPSSAKGFSPVNL